jgi:hypothetical protein
MSVCADESRGIVEGFTHVLRCSHVVEIFKPEGACNVVLYVSCGWEWHSAFSL